MEESSEFDEVTMAEMQRALAEAERARQRELVEAAAEAQFELACRFGWTREQIDYAVEYIVSELWADSRREAAEFVESAKDQGLV